MKFEVKPFQFALDIIMFKRYFVAKFQFWKGSSQASKTHQLKKNNEERERRGKGGRSLGSLWKKKKKKGQCDFLEPKFWADQKEHSALGQSRKF